ncbi:hypothetical protein J1C56_02395 [Aminobacter anthyllidis]|uniref:Uncharacterized protein n=1 Tax=Aminobacter anthyllidis TaxID=1035067 RepID=A0A9X1A705_9HYPH|nr:hypothetical protein [Aminobacter anthyllidis]MBT1154434.1 hypothetical protein [Aminobacter anthyllidis]
MVDNVDIRYYAISSNGRMLLQAETDEEALNAVEASYYHRRTAKRIVRETRETIHLRDPA